MRDPLGLSNLIGSSDKPHISQSAHKRAADRAARRHDDDEGLTLNEIAEDEATRRPRDARANRRARRAVVARYSKRIRRMQARWLIAERLNTPAPSRRAARLIAEREQEEVA